MGIYTIKETTSRIQPWHGSCVLQVDGLDRLTATVLSKLELETSLCLPIYTNDNKLQPLCYASKAAASLLIKNTEFIFNMSTR